MPDDTPTGGGGGGEQLPAYVKEEGTKSPKTTTVDSKGNAEPDTLKEKASYALSRNKWSFRIKPTQPKDKFDKPEEMGARTERAFEEKTAELKGRMDEHAKVLAAVLETVHLASQVDVSELAALQRGVGLELGEESDEARTAEPYPRGGRIPGALPKPRTDEEFVLVVTASAAAAGLLGWLARSWWR